MKFDCMLSVTKPQLFCYNMIVNSKIQIYMKLTKKQKNAIKSEFKQWTETQYAGKDKKERQTKGQFFTPPALTIKMIEKFDSLKDKDILDPTVGAGGLLAACILAGADPKRCYGIELDEEVLCIARMRLAKLGVPPRNLVQGDALDPKSYEKLGRSTNEV